MKILVVGAGAVGGYFGARLAADGNDVTFAVRGSHGEAIRAHGLTVRSETGEVHLPVVALLDDPLRAGLFDIVILAVKMGDLLTAAELVRPVLHHDAAVVPLQNGVEATAMLRRALGPRVVCGGVAYIGGAIEAPGVIRHEGRMARLVFGELDGGASWRLDALAAACAGAGIDHELSPQIMLEIWKKFVFLAPFATITTAAMKPIGAIREDARLWRTFSALIGEAGSVARAHGIALQADFEATRLEFARGLPASMQSSMLTDLQAGKPLEVEFLTGALLRLGEEKGVATPVAGRLLEQILANASAP